MRLERMISLAAPPAGLIPTHFGWERRLGQWYGPCSQCGLSGFDPSGNHEAFDEEG